MVCLTSSDLENGASEKIVNDNSNTFSFKDISFTLSTDKKILQNINGLANSGDFVALMGSSGNGFLASNAVM